MSIQRVTAVNFTSNSLPQNKIVQNKKQGFAYKQIGFEDFIFIKPYNISFKGKQESSVPIDEDFQKSLDDYYRLKPDKFQIEAAKHLFDNEDHLVPAPTGTGKTLIAEYIINKNLEEGKTTYYTTPLKALSNEKYTDFCKLFGKENVGLMTGDVKINRNAPVVIMTTEIYRNMLLGDSKEELDDKLRDVATVIYDEFHYMNDPERGEVWETSIMYTPAHIQQLLLSATADNAPVIIEWMNRLQKEKGGNRIASMTNISPDERHVPLKYFIYDPKRSKTSITPLTKEKFDLKKLNRCLYPNSDKHLTEKQKEVLSMISLKNNGDGTPKNGMEILLSKVPEKSGELEKLESFLAKRFNIEPLEAKRAAALLSDKSQTKFNEALKIDKMTKEQKKAFYSNGTKKVISLEKVDELLIDPTLLSHGKKRAFVQFSRLTSGDSTPEDGLEKVKKILGKNDMSVKDFEKRLENMGLKQDYINDISKALTIEKTQAIRPEEFDLIDTLEREDKLPAIIFSFSRKNCDYLKKEFLKTGKSLLTPDEQEKAAEIVKKYTDKGLYLGAFDEKTDFLSGVAVHHAGKMPSYKALVEELAQNKLVKAVFATSTLGAGINVPAKTVVFTQLDRYAKESANTTGEKFVDLTPSEFQQMAGRAGRRGKDSIGNVVIIPDKKHSPAGIFNLVSASADPINSNFKPTYSFLSHLIDIEHSADNVGEALDKSFLKERLESAGEKPEKILKEMKNEFSNMAKVLTDPEMECFVEKNGKLYSTTKGKIVAKSRGLDGLLFAETVLKSGLEYLSPEELAAVACALTPTDDRNDEVKTYALDDAVIDVLYGIDRLNDKIKKIQDKYNASEKIEPLNRYDAQFITKWAKSSSEDSRKEWERIIKENTKENVKLDEGEFLKNINRTVDVLQQIREVSLFAADEAVHKNEDYYTAKKMRKISDTAAKALALMQRDPVIYDV